MIERHFHWKFHAYNHKDVIPPNETRQHNLINMMISCEVVGQLSEAGALIAVQEIVERDVYYLHSVWECSRCGFEESTKDSLEKLAR